MMKKTIWELISEADGYLAEHGYARGSCGVYRRAWSLFKEWCLDAGVHFPTGEHAGKFISEGHLDIGGKGYRKQLRRAVLVLLEYGQTGIWRRSFRTARIALPACLDGVWEDYRLHLEPLGLKERTVYGKMHALKCLLSFLHSERGIEAIGDLGADDVLAYAEHLGGFAESTRSQGLFFLREYLGYAVPAYGLDPGLAGLFPTILANSQAVLPSVYSPGEVKALVEAARRGRGPCRRRDLAVIMLAVTTGMRVGDIKELRLDSIDWRKKAISFTQQKGGRRNTVPLTSECALALADYMRSERPESDDPHVFIMPQAPYAPYSGYNSFHAIVTRCFTEAGIDFKGRHHGMHSLRHSLAVGMLSQKAPYPVVSGVLGHECANTTKRYLRVDLEALRPLCLEVPYARS